METAQKFRLRDHGREQKTIETMTEDRFDTDEDGERTIEEIAEELGEVKVSKGFLKEKEVEKGEQFGYEK